MEGKQQFLLNRLKWVSFYRVIIAFCSLLLLIFWKSRVDVIPESSYFITILIFIFAISIAYGIFIRKTKKPFLLIILQITIDLLVISFIVIATAGVESPFIFFYAFIILESGIFFAKKGAYTASLVNVFCIGLIFFFQYKPFYPFNRLLSGRIVYSSQELFYSFSIFSLEFLILGLLVGYLTSEAAKMRENLAESEAKVYDLEYLKSAILSGINEGLVVFDGENVTYINEVAKGILNKISTGNHEEVIRKVFADEIEDAKKQRGIIKFEKRLPAVTGENMWLAFTISPLMDHNNVIIGNLISLQDLTNYKDMEDKNQR